MAVFSGADKLGKEISDALGLKHVRRLDIHLVYDEIATVVAEFYPEEDGVRQIVPILKKFELLEIQEPKVKTIETIETTVIGDQINSFGMVELR